MRIYIDRLKEGQENIFNESVDCSEIFDAEEVGVLVIEPVEVSFKAYLAGHELIIEWQFIKARCLVNCTVCNDKFNFQIEIQEGRHIEPLSSIRGAVFNPSSLVRELILLDIPSYAECKEGDCPERETLKRYIEKESYGSTT
ncbi:MAG: hypothetical protein NTY13_00055 [Chlamydiae bacterium]|nr:hypothetical protein [Chlamydiota bacterium]